MQSIQRQKGLSAIGWLFILTVFGFSLLIGFKLGGHYLDNRFVVSTLKTLADNPDLPRMSSADIRSSLKKTFAINNVRGKPVESVKVSKGSKGILVSVKYEERIHILHNIDVVLTFNSVLDSSQPGKCCSASQK